MLNTRIQVMTDNEIVGLIEINPSQAIDESRINECLSNMESKSGEYDLLDQNTGRKWRVVRKSLINYLSDV